MLECLKCNRNYKGFQNRCECGEVLYPVINSISQLQLNEKLTMGEGNTPTLRLHDLESQFGCKELYIKNETTNPTGSFKDRGSIKEVTTAMKMGYHSISVASTGNMGISLAAYSAYFGLECNIFIPMYTSIEKQKKMKSYGARVFTIDGHYDDCVNVCEHFVNVDHSTFLTGDYHLRMLGMLSLGYELECYNPDVIICPVGNGNLLYSLYLSNKLLAKTIRLIGVQIEGYSTITDRVQPVDHALETVCPAVEVQNPLQGLGVLKALKETNGFMITVTNKEARNAQYLMMEHGIYLEPSGALPIAGIIKLNMENKKVICIGTGRN